MTIASPPLLDARLINCDFGRDERWQRALLLSPMATRAHKNERPRPHEIVHANAILFTLRKCVYRSPARYCFGAGGNEIHVSLGCKTRSVAEERLEEFEARAAPREDLISGETRPSGRRKRRWLSLSLYVTARDCTTMMHRRVNIPFRLTFVCTRRNMYVIRTYTNTHTHKEYGHILLNKT